LGTAEGIQTVASVRVLVKWPNDLLLGESKVGGILCESGAGTRNASFQVIGIGINVNGTPEDFPEELRRQATSIRHESGRIVDRNRLIAQVLQELESCLDEFLKRGRERIALAYRQRCTTIGRTVKALLADGEECVGVAHAIDEDGSLMLIQPSIKGSQAAPAVRQLHAADIVHLR
jgi:BirA family biotin operon repressor/biotin-[acetyl-CoA-carboxylase] ligase